MPEGDTVWLTARRLDAALGGGTLTRTDFRVPQLATTDLTGREVLGVVSRGKHLLLRVAGRAGDRDPGGLTLHTHLRMDGSWHLYRPGTPWRGGPDHQVRVVLATADWHAVGYRLPVVELVPTAAEDAVVGHLGPDLLDPDADLAEAVRRLLAQPEREIGVALLDQRDLAGIGNLYKAETLFLRRVNPWTPVAEVGDLAELVALAQRLLHANREHARQVTTGDDRRGREHWVFERAGRACRRCGTRIRVAEQGVAPRQRLTYWCPGCQPAVRAG